MSLTDVLQTVGHGKFLAGHMNFLKIKNITKTDCVRNLLNHRQEQLISHVSDGGLKRVLKQNSTEFWINAKAK